MHVGRGQYEEYGSLKSPQVHPTLPIEDDWEYCAPLQCRGTDFQLTFPDPMDGITQWEMWVRAAASLEVSSACRSQPVPCFSLELFQGLLLEMVCICLSNLLRSLFKY